MMILELLLPEILLLVFLVVLMVGEMLSFQQETSKKTFQTFVLSTGCLTVFIALLPLFRQITTAFGGMVIIDPFASFFKVIFIFAALIVIRMSWEFFRTRPEKSGEFLLILWSSLIGFFFLVSSNDFLMLFISLEIIALSFYIMTAYLKKQLISIEAGIKYLIMGSLASAFLIFGISLLYGAYGFTDFPSVRQAFTENPHSIPALLGFVLILSGLGFKIASVPFQLWVPDVYEGAPTPVVAFLSVASKSAGFAALLRVLYLVFPALNQQTTTLFSILALMTLVYGNLAALVQTNIKRLFGYSSIGHAGYILIGVAAGGFEGVNAVLYYLLAYAVTTLSVFFIITLAGNFLHNDRLESYKGLGKRSPFLAGTLFLALLSSAGVPPLAGFSGKFLVLLAAVKSHLIWLVLIGALGVAVSLYYYLNIVKIMYFEESEHQDQLPVSLASKSLLIILSLLILAVGLVQLPFLELTQNAAHYLF